MTTGITALDVSCAVCHAKPDEGCVDLPEGQIHEGRDNYARLCLAAPHIAPEYFQERLRRAKET